VQPLTWADTERANALPPLHKDPMDRMLIAQALNADMPIITDDSLYPGYGVRTIW
jgi:PIN domain nuclease of toxin-antitoxin system